MRAGPFFVYNGRGTPAARVRRFVRPAMHAHTIELILGLLVAVAALAWLASRLRIAYPILLVIGGLCLSLIPFLPRVQLAPDIVFLLFLPPLLYYAGLLTTWRDFRNNLRPISLLAVGLVLFTMCLVAVAAYYLVPGLTWPAAFILGAIVSPPDAVAATAILQRLGGVPRRVIAVLEGESLVNDATALVAYRLAVVAALAGTFSFADAGLRFLWMAAGGLGIGYAVGWAIAWVRPRIREPAVEGTGALLTPFIAYLPAEWAGSSGVLAVVTTGIYLSRRLPHIVSARVRLRAYAVWEIFVFILNGLIFILIGLQLPVVLGELTQQYSAGQLLGYAGAISVVTIAARMVWVFPATYVPRFLFPRFRKRDPYPPVSEVTVIAWTGMRGIVSLAAALALPLTLDGPGGTQRALILFITFGVIFATLVVQGLTLAPLIRRLRLQGDDEEKSEETTARYLSALAAVERLDQLAPEAPGAAVMIARMRAMYDERVHYYSTRIAGAGGSGNGGLPAEADENCIACESGERVIREAVGAERRMLVRLRDDGVIGDDVLRRVQEELDLEESKLEREA